MAPIEVNRVVRHLRLAALGQDISGLTDGELLSAYVGRRDEAAFETLVRRHGAMVLGVCRRVLHNQADAEDAFQATFLVLVRKAGSIRSPGAVAGWLHGVAHTTALKAKVMNRKRRTRELEAGTLPKHQGCDEVWRAVQTLLDAELACLPEKYRIAIVLCDLEGKTIKEAARHLGCPQGTAATRLTRGRALLARRLARHGLVVSVGALSAALAHGIATATVPPALVFSTLKATSLFAAGPAAAAMVSARVAALTQGVIQAMFLTKLKSCVLSVVVLALLGAGVGTIVHGISAQDVGLPPGATQPQPPGKQIQDNNPASLKQEIERLRAELERTRLALQRAQYENALLKAQAQLAEAQARLAQVQAEDAVRKAALAALSDVEALNKRKAREAELRTAEALAAIEAAYRADANRKKDVLKLKGALQADPLPKNLAPPKANNPDPAAGPSAIAPDGRSVATANGNRILLLDLSSGKILFSIEQDTPAVSMAFSPDGKLLATSGKDNAVLLWDSRVGKQLRKLVVPNPVLRVRFSPDARVILVSDGDNNLREFDAATGKELRVLRVDKDNRP